MEDIAKSSVGKKAVRAPVIRIAAILISVASLSSCVGAGLDVFSADRVDRSVSTGTVTASRSEDHSDEATVQNAVTSADLNKLAGSSVPWANSSTGSAGVISSISEDRDTGSLCRAFTTTRHAYDGIASFDGRTCLMDDGRWHLLAFQRDS